MVFTLKPHREIVAKKRKRLHGTELLVYIFNHPGQTANEIAAALCKTPSQIRRNLDYYYHAGYLKRKRVPGGLALNNGLKTIWMINEE